jgi:hypothetical protein
MVPNQTRRAAHALVGLRRLLLCNCPDFPDHTTDLNMEKQDIEKEAQSQIIFRWIAAVLVSVIIAFVVTWFAQDVGLNSIMFAFWLNWLLMFWAYAIHRSQTIKFPEKYFRTRPSETNLYRLIGVKYYQRFLRRISIFNPELQLKKGRASLPQLVLATKDAEQAHTLIYLIIVGFMTYALLKQWWLAAFWYFLFNLLINGYPVMVQRYNRTRIVRLLK